VLWLIEHHPESRILGLDIASLFPNRKLAGMHHGAVYEPEDFIRARELWKSVLAQNSDNAEVLHNAARFFESTDFSLSGDLARRLSEIDPKSHGELVSDYFKRVAPGFLRFGPEPIEGQDMQQ
jgi:hypothetical protein